MKIQAQSSILLRQALQKAAKCIDSKSTIVALSNVLLTQRKEDGKFFFVAGTTDSELILPAPLSIVDGSFNEDVVLPIGNLLSLLSTLPDCVITIDLSQDKECSMNIEYCTQNGENVKKGNVSLVYFSADSFPRATQPDDASLHISLPMAIFSNVLAHAGKFVGNTELRPIMNCLCIDVAEDRSEVIFVASDGHVLIKLIHTNNPETGGSNFFRSGTPGKILVEKSFFKTLSVFDDCEDIDIEANESMVRFTSGDDITFVCKKVAGQYPNYNSVIPKNNPYTVVVDKRELASVVKRVALFSSESSNMIVLKKEGMFLDVEAQDIDFSMAANDQVIITDSNCPEDHRIAFKASSLLDSLAPIPSDTICLHLSDPSRAGVITANESSPRALTLLMPMILEE